MKFQPGHNFFLICLILIGAAAPMLYAGDNHMGNVFILHAKPEMRWNERSAFDIYLDFHADGKICSVLWSSFATTAPVRLKEDKEYEFKLLIKENNEHECVILEIKDRQTLIW